MRIDGYDAADRPAAAVTVADDHVEVDYAGTSAAVGPRHQLPAVLHRRLHRLRREVRGRRRRSRTTPARWMRSGSRRPESTIVNAPHPCAGDRALAPSARCCPTWCFGCLHQAMPERVPAEGTSSLWNLKLGAGPRHRPAPKAATPPSCVDHLPLRRHRRAPGAGRAVGHALPVRRAQRAGGDHRGDHARWCSGARNYRRTPAAPARQRGGLGQVMEVEQRDGAPFGIFATFERVKHPARGRDGGEDGRRGRLSLASGTELSPRASRSSRPGSG